MSTHRVKLLAGACALAGAAAGAGTTATYAAYSDTESAATQSITAASCFDRSPSGQGNRFGQVCAGKDNGQGGNGTSSTGSSPSPTPTATSSPTSTTTVTATTSASPTATTLP